MADFSDLARRAGRVAGVSAQSIGERARVLSAAGSATTAANVHRYGSMLQQDAALTWQSGKSFGANIAHLASESSRAAAAYVMQHKLVVLLLALASLAMFILIIYGIRKLMKSSAFHRMMDKARHIKTSAFMAGQRIFRNVWYRDASGKLHKVDVAVSEVPVASNDAPPADGHNGSSAVVAHGGVYVAPAASASHNGNNHMASYTQEDVMRVIGGSADPNTSASMMQLLSLIAAGRGAQPHEVIGDAQRSVSVLSGRQ